MKPWYVLQHGWNLKTCKMKELSHKGPYNIWFCLYEMPEEVKTIEIGSILVVA